MAACACVVAGQTALPSPGPGRLLYWGRVFMVDVRRGSPKWWGGAGECTDEMEGWTDRLTRHNDDGGVFDVVPVC